VRRRAGRQPAALRRGAAAAAAALAAALLLAVLGAPAAAHEEDPQVVTILDGVTPAVPGLELAVVTGVAPQLLLTNRTQGPVEVLDGSGRAFLRIGPADVQIDLARAAAYESESPFGGAKLPARVQQEPDAAPRFYRVLTGGSYGWFDHRLHPATLTSLPPGVREGRAAARLSDWTVPLRVGGREVTARGHLEFRPLVGAFATSSDPVPAGLRATVLQGRLPGLAVAADPGREVVVTGAAGEPFARLSPRGAEVNESSPTWVADRAARGLADGPDGTPLLADPAAAPRWLAVGATPTLTWLDARLRWPDQVPPAAALASEVPVVLARWRVPVTVDGRAAELAGAVTWAPAARLPGAPAPGPGEQGGGRLGGLGGWWVLAGAIAAALALAGLASVALRARRAPRGSQVL